MKTALALSSLLGLTACSTEEPEQPMRTTTPLVIACSDEEFADECALVEHTIAHALTGVVDFLNCDDEGLRFSATSFPASVDGMENPGTFVRTQPAGVNGVYVDWLDCRGEGSTTRISALCTKDNPNGKEFDELGLCD